MPTKSSNKIQCEIDPRRIEVIDHQSAAVMAKLSGTKRIQLACQMGDALRSMVKQHLRRMHPEWTDTQMREEMIRRAGHGKSI